MSGEEPQAAPPAVPPKQDPESLVLRGRPRPVVRFRRGLIIGLSAAVAAALILVAWAALEPPSFRMPAEQVQGEPFSAATPEVIAGMPESYGDVPQLGPPLPGDLGRPILEHQRRLDQESAGDRAGSGGEADEARIAAEAERERQALERARESALLVQQSGAAAAASGSAAIPEEPRGASGDTPERDVSPHSLREAPSRWTLGAGTIIPASLITGLNSDLPGMVLAQVTEPVRDSATGRTVLIPQGARLVGRYDAVVAYGQRRALLAWERIMFPDGSSVRLDDMPAADLSGYAGVADGVDFHSWRLLKGIALSALLGVGAELSLGSGEGDLVRAVRESAQQSGARAGDRITSRNLDVQPTLTVRPGWPLRAIVNKDLVLRPWEG
jgi:type IV secretion system protein TrbI